MTDEQILTLAKTCGFDDWYARNAIREIARWLEENEYSKCAIRLKQEADNYDD